LEGFLLHYRNLLEFFSGEHRPGRHDMSTTNSNVWANRTLSAPEIAAIVEPAKVLDARHYQAISRYLQHCTLLRHEQSMAWDVAEMKRAMVPIIDGFVRAFPR
jgi:hypothetical protein